MRAWSWPAGRGAGPAPSPGDRAPRPARATHEPTCARASWPCACARPTGDIPRAADGSLPECWLLAEWPPGAAEPTDYWLSTLPADTPLRELVRIATIRWRVERDYRELKDGLGLDHSKAAATSAGTGM